VSEPRAEWLRIEVRQQDWMPGFGAFINGGTAPQGEAHIVINIGAHALMLRLGEMTREEMPYALAETMMHEVMHALESWARVEFNEERIEALLDRYAAARAAGESQ
jgi:hypothetical protein